MSKTVKTIIFIILIIFIWAIYIFIRFPSIEKIENKLKNKYTENITPDKTNYDSLVKKDFEENRTILLGKAKSSEMYDNKNPILTHTFDLNETAKIIKILNDSSSYNWGEIGTPYYDKKIIFYDKNKSEIGYVNISFDGQINVFPNVALTKWGLLSDKGFKELVIAIRTE